MEIWQNKTLALTLDWKKDEKRNYIFEELM